MRLSERARTAKLTLISAPVRFGETALLSDWVGRAAKKRPELAVAWLTLDDGDNDPARFLAYWTAALRHAHPVIASSVKPPTAQAPWCPEKQARTALARLINEMSGCDARVALVLDDYHLIVAQPIHSALSFLIEHLPANLSLVIATRGNPPLPLAGLRGRGQLSELRQGDLRFISYEATAFLNETMGLHLETHDLADLLSRTKGWIAGLQMAAISIRGHAQRQGSVDPSRFAQEPTGSHRYTLDYLTEAARIGQQTGNVTIAVLSLYHPGRASSQAPRWARNSSSRPTRSAPTFSTSTTSSAFTHVRKRSHALKLSDSCRRYDYLRLAATYRPPMSRANIGGRPGPHVPTSPVIPRLGDDSSPVCRYSIATVRTDSISTSMRTRDEAVDGRQSGAQGRLRAPG
jgi:hypothetical protein